MKIIGIVGGIGASKSTIVSLIQAEYNIFTISADLIGHQILLEGQAAYQPVIEAFGTEILDETQAIDRKKLGAKVFGSEEALSRLNHITHPCIKDEIKRKIEAFHFLNKEGIVLLEAALLIETGMAQLVDYVIAIYTPEAMRIQRVMERDTVKIEAVKKRIAAQISWEEMKQHSNFIIDNSISLDNTKRQLKEVMNQIIKEEPI